MIPRKNKQKRSSRKIKNKPKSNKYSRGLSVDVANTNDLVNMPTLNFSDI